MGRGGDSVIRTLHKLNLWKRGLSLEAETWKKTDSAEVPQAWKGPAAGCVER